MDINGKLEKVEARMAKEEAKLAAKRAKVQGDVVARAIRSTVKGAYKKVIDAASMIDGLKANYPSATFDEATNGLLSLAATIRATEEAKEEAMSQE